ncbi:MAG: hypothetical protein KC983_02695 [Phycisphaerales bacterium]|nr:hypothetical protein [Phycisphaerales bacterium]
MGRANSQSANASGRPAYREKKLFVSGFHADVDDDAQEHFSLASDRRRIIAALLAVALDAGPEAEDWLIQEARRMEREGESPVYDGMAQRFADVLRRGIEARTKD